MNATFDDVKAVRLVINDPVGIVNDLFKNRNWIKNIPENTILIEDSVHMIVNPDKIKIYKNNHFSSFSLTKNSSTLIFLGLTEKYTPLGNHKTIVHLSFVSCYSPVFNNRRSIQAL